MNSKVTKIGSCDSFQKQKHTIFNDDRQRKPCLRCKTHSHLNMQEVFWILEYSGVCILNTGYTGQYSFSVVFRKLLEIEHGCACASWFTWENSESCIYQNFSPFGAQVSRTLPNVFRIPGLHDWNIYSEYQESYLHVNLSGCGWKRLH